jgi:hypothetical protein
MVGLLLYNAEENQVAFSESLMVIVKSFRGKH